MQIFSKVSAIVAVFCALTFISGCGQRRPLYLPKIPALPADIQAAPASSEAAVSVDATSTSADSNSPPSLP